ncbi:MAG: hypothetical protein Q8O89_02675 [Nanoarchaeota archaeon]|nr:hypothetical protein [Nanoarchaeota archaeon]
MERSSRTESLPFKEEASFQVYNILLAELIPDVSDKMNDERTDFIGLGLDFEKDYRICMPSSNLVLFHTLKTGDVGHQGQKSNYTLKDRSNLTELSLNATIMSSEWGTGS